MSVLEVAATLTDSHSLPWLAQPFLALQAFEVNRSSQIREPQPLAAENPSIDTHRRIQRLLLAHASGYGLRMEHFVLFRQTEMVEVILEDSFGFIQGVESDKLLLPYQNEVLQILIDTMFPQDRMVDGKDIQFFLSLFSTNPPVESNPAHQDRTLRFKSMLWFIYLAIDVVKIDGLSCERSSGDLRARFKDMLDRAIDGTIIDENRKGSAFESGKWDRSLFGWLQGEDRKCFALKLRQQFNQENRTDHGNRLLLAEHRKRIFDQVLRIFGRKSMSAAA